MGDEDTSRSTLTVITVTYQAVDSLEETIKSVISLQNISFQYLVIDGGSTDGTLSIIKKYSDRIDYWISEHDAGIYDGMNRGLDQATGRWVLFLNAGDRITQEINRLTEFSPNDYALVHGYTRLIGGPVEYDVRGHIRNWSDWIVKDGIYHQSIAYNRAEILPYDLSYKIVADREMTARLLRNSKRKIGLIPNIVCHYDVNGFSGSRLNKLTCEMLRLSFSLNYYSGCLYVLLRYPVILIHRFVSTRQIYRIYRRLVGRLHARA